MDMFLGKKIQLKGKSKSLVNNWNTVISSERNCYIHVMKNAICMYDKNSNELINVWKGVKDVVDEAGCDSITLARQFANSDYLHFATDHHMFLLDIRFCTQFKPEVVRRWTHGMSCPPVYINTCSYDLKQELMCLSSQWVEDMCVIPSYAKDILNDPIKGFTLPYRPPSILNVLAEAREQLLCSDIYNSVDGRLTTSICGTLVLEHSDTYQTLLLNSLGDIINHSLYPEHIHSFVLDEGPKQLHEWSKSYIVPQKPFEVSKIVDFGSILRDMKIIPNDVKIMSDVDDVKFDEKEVLDAFENEEVDSTLQYAWTGDLLTEAVEADETNIFYEQQDSDVSE
ncbi:unnamed protein product [Leptidea sinapis]|uniref:Uncharacterized protein n=2 Tax=Leptidea sinapis TaxID=189913 RepID=A0A5E4Q486_9NEOP|nr:unnamed protein product [Leptidea sinapis]